MAIVERRTLKVGNLVGRARRIALISDNDLRALRELCAILLELTVNNAIVLDRITILKPARHVNDMHNQSSALDMTQELMAQATPLARALDKTGDIGNDVRIFAGTHHAQVGHKRGKRIVGNLRFGRRNSGQKSRFSGIRETYQTHIGKQFQFENN